MIGGGVVDAQYSGEILVIVHNFSNRNNMIRDFHNHQIKGYQINKGDKIAQLLIQKVELPAVNEITYDWNVGRGTKGFGSSGT